MKRRKLAWALLFLGIGLFVGLALGRGSSRISVLGRGADRIERVIVEDGVRSRFGEEIVIEVPPIPTMTTTEETESDR